MLTCMTLVCDVRERLSNYPWQCLQTKLLRKPYMGNLYVRFDEGEGSAKSRPSLLYCSAQKKPIKRGSKGDLECLATLERSVPLTIKDHWQWKQRDHPPWSTKARPRAIWSAKSLSVSHTTNR